METFADNDAGYLSWLADHPDDGYVLNTYRTPRPSYLRLHTAQCHLIQGTPASGAAWTHHYIKVCGDRDTLTQWATNVVGGEVTQCQRCSP